MTDQSLLELRKEIFAVKGEGRFTLKDGGIFVLNGPDCHVKIKDKRAFILLTGAGQDKWLPLDRKKAAETLWKRQFNQAEFDSLPLPA